MRIAFYAPLKPPDHPTPSGDREIARALIEGLSLHGHEVIIASRLRALRGGRTTHDDPQLAAAVARQIDGLTQRYGGGNCVARPSSSAMRGRAKQTGGDGEHRRAPRPDLWLTYHVYHKAPDWLGPAVSRALNIPYVIAEAAVSPKHAAGRFAHGYRAVLDSVAAADGFVHFNPRDRECVERNAQPHAQHLESAPFARLAPFLAVGKTRAHAPISGNGRTMGGPVRLITTAMLRPGDKAASFAILAAALGSVRDLNWELEVIGDGPARAQIMERFSAPGLGERITWHGALARHDVAKRLAAADVFVWPAVNEAIGLALIEAQAAGLPVVAGRAGAIGNIVNDGVTGHLVPVGDSPAFASALRALITDRAARQTLGAAAHRRACIHFDLPAVSGALSQF
ncbi:MAG: glycosyltransferase family 4 protein, partial [Pseudomonadota bacterium]